MFFGHDILTAVLGQGSRRETKPATGRLRRKQAPSVQLLEGRTLLSHVGVVHVRHSSSAIVAKLDQRHGHGRDDGAQHNAQDDKGGRGRDRATGPAVTAASQGRNGKDDGAAHDATDDRGIARRGKDDPANHDANDNRGGHGKDDGAGHK